jgi:hypothetical protein
VIAVENAAPAAIALTWEGERDRWREGRKKEGNREGGKRGRREGGKE